MDSPVRLTPATAKVLRRFLEDLGQPRYGFDLMQSTGLASGTLYPILARLERTGWIAGHQEDIDTATEGRPARRFYTMSADAVPTVRRALAEMAAEFTPPGLGWSEPAWEGGLT